MSTIQQCVVTLNQIADAFKIKHGSLPTGYTQLEYIENSDQQYIDTGIQPNQDTRFVLDIMFNGSSNSYLFGARRDSNHDYNPACGILYKSTGFRSDYGVIQGATVNGAVAGVRYLIDKDGPICKIGEYSTANTERTFEVPFSTFIFAINQEGNPSYFSLMRLWSCKLYDNKNLVRDYIPAKRDNDGAIGLYDIVNNEFYGNAGSGEFVAGPQVLPAPNVGDCACSLSQFSMLTQWFDNK